MTPDETPIPEDDAIAAAARRALQGLARSGATEPVAWAEVQTGARRVQRRRVAVVGAVCAAVIVLAGVAVVTIGNNRDHVNVAAPSSTTSTSTSSTTSTTEPPTSTTLPEIPRRQCRGVSCGTTPVVGPPPAVPTTVGIATPSNPTQAPGVDDFSGTITLGDGAPTPVATASMAVGDEIEISSTVRNETDHAISTSSITVPTSLATVCTGESTGRQSLWWMTNILLAPGNTSGRGGNFEPTDAYVGSVSCEVDIVTTDRSGTLFDTQAGGDEARATIIGPVAAIAAATITVAPQPATTTTVGAPTTTTPEPTSTTTP